MSVDAIKVLYTGGCLSARGWRVLRAPLLATEGVEIRGGLGRVGSFAGGACPLAAGALAALLLILVGVGRGDEIDPLRRVTGPHEQDLVRWEVGHFTDKWRHLATGILRAAPTPSEWGAAVDEFFALADTLRDGGAELERALAGAPGAPALLGAQQRIADIEERRAELAPVVEETIEAATSQVVDELGIIDRYGPARWPPVDFTFAPNGLVLVRSPRDAIVRLGDLLLDPEMGLVEQEELEAEVEALDENVAALVVRVGGIATYPSHVSPTASLHGTLFLVAHEWLHHWLWFRPLGRAWFAGGELTSVNETVANIAAEEIGDLVYERLTGNAVERAPWTPPEPPEPRAEPDTGEFDYRRAMRATRARLEELLDAGDVAEAERYLEERRLLFVANGHSIRKLNTAWFAFHGTYADSPASISPIEGWLRALRADSAGLAEFLDRAAVIDEEGELERIAGGLPLP